ncbi:MAG: hypothetical protein RR664_06395 [Clostridia bacterium]
MHEAKFINAKLFIKYLISKIQEENKKMLYKYYISDRLNTLANDKHYENSPTFYDLLNKKEEKNKDNRTPEEIKEYIFDLIKK